MTGAYLRVKRDGKWCNVEVEHLTHDELIEVFKDRQVLPWLDLVCEKLREAEKLLDSLVEEGILTVEKTEEE